MCIRSFVTILASCCLLALYTGGGCSPEQLDRIDRGVQDANSLAEGVHDIIDSPAGGLLGDKARGVAEAVAGAVSVLALAWQQARKKRLTETLERVVAGVEAAGSKSAVVGKAVKDAIANEMVVFGTLHECNAEIDKVKDRVLSKESDGR